MAEMLCIFDEASESVGALTLLLDATASLARQWILRSGSWKVAAAVLGACLQVMAGGLIWAALRHDGPLRGNTSALDDLALERLMLFVAASVGGLVLMVATASLWMRSFVRRRGRGPEGGQMKWAALAMVALVLAGMIYEQIGERRDWRRYPRIGRSVNIGGRTLNIYCSGEGSPTVVFEGAGHTAGYAWTGMQSEAAKFTRACWYDRAGYGWSDPGPSPRTFRVIAEDLHALLRAAAIPPPYVLVGATSGAFHTRVYNGLYPSEVAGAVLIDADDPDTLEHGPEYMKGSLASLPPVLKRFGCEVLRPALFYSGLARLMGNPGAGRPFGLANLAQAQRPELIFLSNNPTTTRTEGEGCFLDENMAEVRSAGDFGNRPLFVLANSTPFQAPGPQYAKATKALNDYWFHKLHPRLAALSTRGHLVLDERAESSVAVIQAVRNVVTEVRAAEPGRR